MIRRPWNVEADMTVWIRGVCEGLVLLLWLGGAFTIADLVQAAAGS
jgi:hypothetical protein